MGLLDDLISAHDRKLDASKQENQTSDPALLPSRQDGELKPNGHGLNASRHEFSGVAAFTRHRSPSKRRWDADRLDRHQERQKVFALAHHGSGEDRGEVVADGYASERINVARGDVLTDRRLHPGYVHPFMQTYQVVVNTKGKLISRLKD